MAKKKKAKNKTLKKRQESGSAYQHVLDQLYVQIDSRKSADPDTSYAARLFNRGRQQIAKKLGEEAVEVLIEGMRGDRPKLVLESVDLLYHLLALWAATNVKPKPPPDPGRPSPRFGYSSPQTPSRAYPRGCTGTSHALRFAQRRGRCATGAGPSCALRR